jgi:hypothetical protein
MQEFKLNKVFNWQLWNNKINQTAYYSHSLIDGNVITVNTLKGIIEIDGIEDPSIIPDPAFASAAQIYINNPSLILTEANKDNIYVQLTPYYKPTMTDAAIPYLISNGVLIPNGLGVQIYNASPTLAGANQWEGSFYLYYEIYTIN